MKNILFIADVPLMNPSSGSEQVLKSQALGLTREGFDVFAITRQNGKLNYIENREVMGVREACYFADVESLFGFFFSLLKNPRKIFNDLPIDDSLFIAVCHQPFTYLALLVRGKLQKAFPIYIFHSPNHDEYRISKGHRMRWHNFPQFQIRKIIERYCLKRSRKVIVLSQYMKQKVMDLHRIKEVNIAVNPGGVDLDRFYPVNNRSQIKEKLNLPPRKNHLLTVRNLEPRMGLDNLIASIDILKKNEVNVHLNIVGDGPERKNLENSIKDYGISNDVTMTGYIPSEILPQYFSAADFFILPTMHLEGFGLVTVESLACGTPVLGTPVGGTKEILSNFNSKLLFKDTSPEEMAKGIESAIDDYIRDKNDYGQLRNRCREYAVKNYSWQRHIKQLKSIIDEVSCKKELTN